MSPGRKSAKRKSKTSSKALELVNAANSQVNIYVRIQNYTRLSAALRYVYTDCNQ